MPIVYLSLRYCIVFFIAVLLTMALTVGLQAFAGMDAPSILNMVTTIVPAFDAGASFVRKTRRKFVGGEAWLLAMMLTGLNLLLGVFIFAAIVVLIGGAGDIVAMVEQIGGTVFAMIVGVVMLFAVLVTRLFLGLGANSEFKRLTKQA